MDSEDFTKEHSEAFLGQQWLVKLDTSLSVPYLFKVLFSENVPCSILITDTKSVWAENLNTKHVTRRWRSCNPNLPMTNGEESRERLRTLLKAAHSASPVSDASFEVLESPDADLAFELDFDSFKWRWETYRLGPKTSADVLSRHLIVPLISLTHLAFNSADPVSELDENELEKAADNIGKSARRSTDIHVKQTLGKPRIATTLHRISSLFGFSDAQPMVKSEADDVDLEPLLDALQSRTAEISTLPPPTLEVTDSSKDQGATAPGDDKPERSTQKAEELERLRSPLPPPTLSAGPSEKPAQDRDSETESETDGAQASRNISNDKDSERIDPGKSAMDVDAAEAKPAQEPDVGSQRSKAAAKKRKTPESDSDSDSDAGRKGGRAKAPPRGVRQPLKRGGKKF